MLAHGLETTQVEVPDDMKVFVESQVAAGRYADESEYVRDLIRSRRANVDRLCASLKKAMRAD